ncbi:MAG: glycosyltransferase family 39 protein [Clostridiales bacterium]|jgi:Gpi18-like mannosyltransferase|nr:glycosyltransferase family 39 protein [Clostridiales bacterium]
MLNINTLGINLAGAITLGIVFVAVLIVLAIYSVWGLSRVLAIPNNRNHINVRIGKASIKTALAFILVLGIVVRIVASILVAGDDSLTFTLVQQYNNYQDLGLGGYLTNGIALYPVSYIINGVFGQIGDVFGDAEVLSFFLRLPFVLADIASALVLYSITRKYVNKQAAIIVTALFFFNPVFFLNSSIAGQYNSLLILTLLLTFYFLTLRKTAWMIVMYGLSLLIHRDAQIFVAPIAVYVIYLVVRSIIMLRREGKSGMFKDRARNSVIVVPLSIVCVFVGMWLISLPFVANTYGYNPFVFLNRLYIQMIQYFDNYGYNALNLYNLFNRNGEVTAYTFPSLTFGIIFLLLATVIPLVLFLSKRNRANMVLIASFVMLTLGLYFINFTHSTLVPCVALLLLAYVFIKDRRILKVLIALSLAISINQLASLAHGTTLSNGWALGISIVTSIVAIISHIYFTIMILDICMSSNILTLNVDPDATIGQANRNWLKWHKQPRIVQ